MRRESALPGAVSVFAARVRKGPAREGFGSGCEVSPRPGRGEWELVGAGAVGLGRGGPGRAGERLEPRPGLQQDKAVRATRPRGRSSGARARRGPLLRVPGPTGFRA